MSLIHFVLMTALKQAEQGLNICEQPLLEDNCWQFPAELAFVNKGGTMERC